MARPGGNDGGLRGLVDSGASCGTVNPLMRLTTHYTKDRAKLDEGHISTNRKIKTQKQNGMPCAGAFIYWQSIVIYFLVLCILLKNLFLHMIRMIHQIPI